MQSKKPAPQEITFTTLLIGALIGVVMTAANIYLGLYAGLTVSASIPAAVLAAGIFKVFPTKDSLYKSNIVQTMASAGETLAAGAIFTLPALVLVGAWNDFNFWPTTIISISGGLLGVIFMIPLRKALIVKKSKDLTYPEGVACAKVLQNTAAKSDSDESTEGLRSIFYGLTLGGLFKLFTSGFQIFAGTVEKATTLGGRVFFFGSDMSPALVGVGYIVKLQVASLVLIGGIVGWFIGIPLLAVEGELASLPSLDAAWTLWSTQIRYMGVGAMLVGGLTSIITVRKGIADGIGELNKSYANRHDTTEVPRTNQDMSLMGMSIVFIFSFTLMFFLYNHLLDSFGLSLLTSMIMVLSAFPFVAVSSYIVGLVGTSNNPVSGIVIAVLIMTAALLTALGYHGNSAILATLGVASIVCCAACTAGDCSQDLKTGHIIGATPKYQQWAQCLGVLIPAFIIAPVLSLLHGAYGIGDGLKAPQATLFASLTEAFFGEGTLPYDMIAAGVCIAGLILTIDFFLRATGSKHRLPLMPVAVGIYLPFGIAVPLFIGAMIHHITSKGISEEKQNDTGVLMSSGLIAGEALIGVLIAIFISMKIDLKLLSLNQGTTEILSLVAFTALCSFLYKKSKH